MDTLSYTQEYFLCAINNRGIAPYSFDSTFSACLVVGGISELLDYGYIVRTGNGDFAICREWDDGLPYLKPLYDTLMSLRRADDAKGIAGVYLSVLGRKRFDELYSAIGDSLVALGCVDVASKNSGSKNKVKYVPKAEYVKSIIDRVNSDFTDDGTLAEGTLCLSALLDRSMLIKSYFGKVSADIVKRRIEEARNSEVGGFVNTALSACDGGTIAAIGYLLLLCLIILIL